MNDTISSLMGLALANQGPAIKQRLSIYTGAMAPDADINTTVDVIEMLIERGDMQGINYAFAVPIDYNALSNTQRQMIDGIQAENREAMQAQGVRLSIDWGNMDWAGIIGAIFGGVATITGAGTQAPPPNVPSNPNPVTPQQTTSVFNPVYIGFGVLALVVIVGFAIVIGRK